MDLSTITVDDFKAQFRRDFPYLPVYDNAELYNTGNRVYYPTTKLFYDCLADGVTGIPPSPPVDPAKWVKVIDDVDNYIQDQDITNAFAEAMLVFNQGLIQGTDAQVKLVFLYLAAHYLVNDIRAAQRGINGIGAFMVTSRSVGNVAESYGIPQAYLNDPLLAFYTQSTYGLKYLSLILPKLVGNVGVVWGGTLP